VETGGLEVEKVKEAIAKLDAERETLAAAKDLLEGRTPQRAKSAAASLGRPVRQRSMSAVRREKGAAHASTGGGGGHESRKPAEDDSDQSSASPTLEDLAERLRDSRWTAKELVELHELIGQVLTQNLFLHKLKGKEKDRKLHTEQSWSVVRARLKKGAADSSEKYLRGVIKSLSEEEVASLTSESLQDVVIQQKERLKPRSLQDQVTKKWLSEQVKRQSLFLFQERKLLEERRARAAEQVGQAGRRAVSKFFTFH